MAKPSLADDLEAFVATQKRAWSCKTCSLPSDLRRVVEEQRKKGTSYRILAHWLSTKEHPIGATVLLNHFTAGHAK